MTADRRSLAAGVPVSATESRDERALESSPIGGSGDAADPHVSDHLRSRGVSSIGAGQTGLAAPFASAATAAAARTIQGDGVGVPPPMNSRPSDDRSERLNRMCGYSEAP